MFRFQKLIAVLMVVVSLALGWYAWRIASRGSAPRPAPPAATAEFPVLVAVQPIAAGSPIAAAAVKTIALPLRPEGAFDGPAQVVGKVALLSLGAGEPVTRRHLESGDNLAALLQPGERAVAVKVDEVIAVGHHLAPGQRVDVFVSLRRNPEEVPATQAQPVLRDLRVLAVGSRTAARDAAPAAAAPKGGPETPRTAVLAVPAAEVSKLALAADHGHLVLALKPLLPEPATAAAGHTLPQLAAGAPPARNPGARRRNSPTAVEVIRGLK